MKKTTPKRRLPKGAVIVCVKRAVPWDSEGWVDSRSPKRSPCCKDAIYAGVADGIICGSCARCGQYVVRHEPITGRVQIPKDGGAK